MLHPAKSRLKTHASPARAARAAKRALTRIARPAAGFDSSRYFTGSADLGFHNVGTTAMRALARSIHAEHQAEWSIGKTDMSRLERYLRANGPAIPRTTLRYAIERFPEAKRRALLSATRPRARPRGLTAENAKDAE